jgi:hypothetical protein
MTADALLSVLPPYKGRVITVVKDQDVDDIIAEVCDAHKYFAKDYDKIAKYFWTGNIYETCKKLFDFCKSHIVYEIETDNDQTTKSPAAILREGRGDCKHYAGFIAGVLDAINRQFGAGIDWMYRFASYDMLSSTPQHVFVVAEDNEGEIWVDPVLKKFDARLQPAHKPINKKIMALQRVSGINNQLYNYQYRPNTVGLVDDVVSVAKDIWDFASNIFGGDQVPNYPVKKKSTFDGLVAIVKQKVPGPPTSIEHAKQLLEMAEKARQEEQQYGNGGDANKTIIMLYGEVIDSLKAYIQQKQAEAAAGSGLTVVPGLTQGGISPLMLLALGGGVLYFANKGRKRVSGRNKNVLPLVLTAGAIFFLTRKKGPQTSQELETNEAIQQAQGIMPYASSPVTDLGAGGGDLIAVKPINYLDEVDRAEGQLPPDPYGLIYDYLNFS